MAERDLGLCRRSSGNKKLCNIFFLRMGEKIFSTLYYEETRLTRKFRFRVHVEHNEFYVERFFYAREIFLREPNGPSKFQHFSML